MAKHRFRHGETMTRAQKKIINTQLPYPRTKGRGYYAWLAEGNRIGKSINQAVENGVLEGWDKMMDQEAPPPIKETVAAIKRSLAAGDRVRVSAQELRETLEKESGPPVKRTDFTNIWATDPGSNSLARMLIEVDNPVGSFTWIGKDSYAVDTNVDALAAYDHWRTQNPERPMVEIPKEHFGISERSVITFTMLEHSFTFVATPTGKIEWEHGPHGGKASSIQMHGAMTPSNPLPESVAFSGIDEAPFIPKRVLDPSMPRIRLDGIKDYAGAIWPWRGMPKWESYQQVQETLDAVISETVLAPVLPTGTDITGLANREIEVEFTLIPQEGECVQAVAKRMLDRMRPMVDEANQQSGYSSTMSAYELYRMGVPDGQIPMTVDEWLAKLRGE